ncbi:MAG: serpin family protein [Lachnospiraceae bacterium]
MNVVRGKQFRKKALCVAVLTAGALLLAGCKGKESTDDGRKNEAENVISAYGMAVETAEYPSMAPYPDETKAGSNYEAFEEEYKAWRESMSALRSASADYLQGMEEFCTVTMQEFLSNAGNENRVYSPVNIYMALAMLAELTDGESRGQVLHLLQTETIEELREKANTLWRANYRNDGAMTRIFASSLWMNEEIGFVKETMKTLADTYYASSYQGKMGSSEFNQALQQWLNEQTGGLLKEQAAEIEMTPETILALATTVYFQAKWADEFSERNTEEGIFHAATGDATCEFMHQSISGNYYWGDKFSAVIRSFEEGGSMYLVLPDEGVTTEELLSDEETLQFISKGWSWENRKYLIVNQSIPKFDVVSDLDLVTGLKNLGVTDVFDAEASDFTPMTTETNQIFVSEVKHTARVKIDEEGCTAAAYTVMMSARAGMPPEETVDFVLDRPFLFVITGTDNVPLFIGIVNQPQ